MRVLVLSDNSELLEHTITRAGDECISCSAVREVSDWPEADFAVSFGYKKIIPKRAIDQFEGRIINIHCSALPYNRGASPNFWSWFDGTAGGVSIHVVTEELDKGPILAQIVMYEDDFRQPLATLKTTYDDLLVAAAGLFAGNWKYIRNRTDVPIKPHLAGDGSYHKSGDEKRFWSFLSDGWQTPVSEVAYLGRIYRRGLR